MQSEIIAKAQQTFQNDERLHALFLSGSFGEGTQDAFSDVDFMAIADQSDWPEILSDWKAMLGELSPIVHEIENNIGAIIYHAVLEDWSRADLVLMPEAGLVNKAQDSVKPIIDRKGYFDNLPKTIAYRGPNRHVVSATTREFIRVLGLTPVDKGRNEVALCVTGCGLLRTHLITLMTQAVPMVDTGGALHLKKILSDEHQQALLDLPAIEANWPSIIAATQTIAKVFVPLARKLAAQADVEWPAKFEEATRAHLIKELGVDFFAAGS